MPKEPPLACPNPPLLLENDSAPCVLAATLLAYKNVELSARFLLWTEAASISLIVLLFLLPGHSHRLAWDANQFSQPAFRLQSVRSGLILAIFSFVGFESATALGAEAVRPLRTIPRAVLGTALLSGLFFVFAAYMEVAAFGEKLDLVKNCTALLPLLAQIKGAAWLAPWLTIGALASFFACALACITAAARTALLISTHGTLPAPLTAKRCRQRNRNPVGHNYRDILLSFEFSNGRRTRAGRLLVRQNEAAPLASRNPLT
jgi:amino acid transporter